MLYTQCVFIKQTLLAITITRTLYIQHNVFIFLLLFYLFYIHMILHYPTKKYVSLYTV